MFFQVKLVRILLLKYSFDTRPEDKTLDFVLCYVRLVGLFVVWTFTVVCFVQGQSHSLNMTAEECKM